MCRRQPLFIETAASKQEEWIGAETLARYLLRQSPHCDVPLCLPPLRIHPAVNPLHITATAL